MEYLTAAKESLHLSLPQQRLILREGDSVKITISEYISPTILARIDCVLIDTDDTGEHFTIVESDVTEKKDDFVEENGR